MNDQPLEFSMRKLGKVIKKMRITGDCIIVIKAGTALAKTGIIEAMVNQIKAMGINSMIVVVDDLDDIRSFNELQMNKAGWFHIEALRKIARAPSSPPPEEEEEEEVVH